MSDRFKMYDTQIIKCRIKKVRKLRNISQEKLANAIKVKRQTVSEWEMGKRIPSVPNMVELCNVLNCSMDYLLGSVDTPEIEPISKASHYSGISAQIIAYGLEHSDYLDCLNFFMHPDNCALLINSINLSTWRKFWIETSLTEIKQPFKDEVYKAYDEFSAITPITEVNKKNYTKFLKNKFPEDKLIIQTGKNTNGYVIKGCFKAIDYQSFFENKEFNYSKFINYLSDTTYEPLSRIALIESQKMKLAKAFINLFTRYLEEE